MLLEADIDLQTARTVLREKRGRVPFREGGLPRFRYVSVLAVYRTDDTIS